MKIGVVFSSIRNFLSRLFGAAVEAIAQGHFCFITLSTNLCGQHQLNMSLSDTRKTKHMGIRLILSMTTWKNCTKGCFL